MSSSKVPHMQHPVLDATQKGRADLFIQSNAQITHAEEDHLVPFSLAELSENSPDERNQIRVEHTLFVRCL